MVEQGAGGKAPEVLMDEIRGLVAANIAGNVQLLTRVGALLSHATRVATSSPSRMPDPASVLTQGLDALVASSAIVNAHSMAIVNELVDVAERALVLPVASGGDRAEAMDDLEPADLRLEGEPGGQAVGRFAVDNEYDAAVQLSFTVGRLTPGRGAAIPASRVTLDPARAVIAAKASIEVGVRVDVTEEFTPGETYTAMIAAAGFQARGVRLHVAVVKREPPVRAEKPAAKAKPAAKRAGKAVANAGKPAAKVAAKVVAKAAAKQRLPRGAPRRLA